MLPRFIRLGHLVLCAIALIALLASFDSAIADEIYGSPPPHLNAYLDKLVSSYPDWIAGYDNRSLVLKTGVKFEISDRRANKSFEELLEKPDIDDMFYVPYPAGTEPKQPPKNFDPGRVRFEPLLLTMYGDCKNNEIITKLRTIKWRSGHGGGRVTITTVNGVDKALEAVSRELDELSTDFVRFLAPSAGTYNCRDIAGSPVRSMHAYGAAIDLNTRYSDYWRWSSKNADNLVWKNQIPIAIVRIFEKHGFNLGRVLVSF